MQRNRPYLSPAAWSAADKTQEVDILRMMNTTAEGSNLSTTTRDDHLGDLVYTEVMTADSYTQITGTPLSLGGE